MGHTDILAEALAIVERELRFSISGNTDRFASEVRRAGLERFKHVVALVHLRDRRGASGASKYALMMDLLRVTTPQKAPGTKYRDPQTQHGKDVNAQLDREFAERVAREP